MGERGLCYRRSPDLRKNLEEHQQRSHPQETSSHLHSRRYINLILYRKEFPGCLQKSLTGLLEKRKSLIGQSVSFLNLIASTLAPRLLISRCQQNSQKRRALQNFRE